MEIAEGCSSAVPELDVGGSERGGVALLPKSLQQQPRQPCNLRPSNVTGNQRDLQAVQGNKQPKGNTEIPPL